MKDKLPGGVEPGCGRLRLPELDIKSSVKVFESTGTFCKSFSHGTTIIAQMVFITL
jgi:hypothetical protein